MLKPPPGAKLYETSISTHWFDEHGIMYATSKRVERTIKHYAAVMELYQQFTKDGSKICLLADATDSMPMPEEVRDFLIAEMKKHIKAHAIVSEAEFKGSLMSTVLQLNWAGFPVMKFATEEEAREWLLQYMRPDDV